MAIDFFTKRTKLWNWLAAGGLAVCLGMIFFFAPTERTMGQVQRLFYFHVGAAWVASVTFFVALVSGILYLRRPHKNWDILSHASVEIGLVFISLTIVSGSVWGRPAWNTWWLWSPRLTSITIMWLVYAAYFMLRGAVDDEAKRNRFAAVYVIAAFVTVLITYGSIRILRDIHPVMFGDALESARGAEQGLQEFSGVDSLYMVITLNVAIVAFSLLYIAWVSNRMRLQQITDQTAALKTRVLGRMRS